MSGGRPLKFESPEALQAMIDDYFDITPDDKQCITGLAVHLDTSRVTLCDYEHKDKFTNTVKKAKERIGLVYELRGIGKGRSYDIFTLKNMGWKDKQEIDQTQKLEISFQNEEAKEAVKDFLNE